jgi:hypothetical protein
MQTRSLAAVMLAALATAPCFADVVAKSRYVSAGKTTELTTYANANRQRIESPGANLIQQCDAGRTIQVDTDAKTFVGLTLKPAPATPATAGGSCAATAAAGFNDTGERKVILGLTAARYKMTAPNCGGKTTTELDGWYAPALHLAMSCPADTAAAAANAASTPPGFLLQYTMTTKDEKGAATQTVTYELMSLQITSTPLETALFEAPEGFKELTVQQAAALQNPAFVEAVKQPKGKPRVGIASQGKAPLDQRLAASFKDPRIEAVPLGGGTPEEIQDRAKQSNVDYILFAELADLKPSQGGGGVTRKLAGVSRLTTGAAPKDSFDATVSYRLVAMGATQPKLSASATGSNNTFTMKDALALARLASQFVVPMFMFSGGVGPNSGLFNVMQMVQQSSYTATSSDPNMAAFSTAIRSFSSGGTEFTAEEGAAVHSATDRVSKAVIASLVSPASAEKQQQPAAKKTKK